MATSTSNLSLRKPEGSDFVSVALDIAGNMQTLDDKWASSAPTAIGPSLVNGSALTVARSDHVHNVGSGSAANPSLPIGESNSGFYRIGSANIGATIAGALAWAFSATGIAIETALALKHVASVSALSGYVKIFAKSDEKLYKETGAGDEVEILDADIFTAQGDLVYGTGAEAYTQLAKGTARQALLMNSGATAPEWGASLASVLTTTGDLPYASSANTPARLAAGNAGDIVLYFGGSPVTSPLLGGGLNPIVNAGLNIWQDGTSFSSIADATWTADNWIYGKAGAVVHDVSRSTNVPAVAVNAAHSNYSLLLDVTTADASLASGDFATIATRIEGFNWLPFAQRALSLSFWVWAAKTGTHCVYFKNSGSDRTYVAEYTVSAADTWEYKTVTASASPSAGTWNYTTGRGLEIGWALSCGSTFQTTAGSWQTGDFKGTANQVNETDNTANNFRIWGPMLTLGASAVPFVGVPMGLENLRACRYNEVFGGDSGAEIMGGMGQAISTTLAVIPFNYVEKRAVPTITVSAATDFVLHDKDNNTLEMTAHSALVPSTTTYLALATVASGLVAGNASYISADTTLDARIYVRSRIP